MAKPRAFLFQICKLATNKSHINYYESIELRVLFADSGHNIMIISLSGSQQSGYWFQCPTLVWYWLASNLTSMILIGKKKDLEHCWYNFLHNFIHVYIAPGQGLTPWGWNMMSTRTSCHFGHLLQVSKKSLWSLILYNFFHDFIHVYSPGAGADNPQGTKFWCQQKCLITSFICCKFKKNIFKLWFYTIFFHD